MAKPTQAEHDKLLTYVDELEKKLSQQSEEHTAEKAKLHEEYTQIVEEVKSAQVLDGSDLTSVLITVYDGIVNHPQVDNAVAMSNSGLRQFIEREISKCRENLEATTVAKREESDANA